MTMSLPALGASVLLSVGLASVGLASVPGPAVPIAPALAPIDGRVCWIQNAGFYIDTPNGDILIDAILSADDEIARAEGPFADVRLIFVSHVHGDHFNAAGIIRHMQANSEAHLIVTPQSHRALQRSGWSDELEARVTVALPDWDLLEPFQIPAFSGHLMQFDHSGTENIGLAVEGGGVRVFYAAGGWHSEDRATRLSALYPDTDMVIANVWPLAGAQYIDGIDEAFSPSWLLMAHHAGRRDSMVQRAGGAESMERAMTREGMRGRIFGTRMECADL